MQGIIIGVTLAFPILTLTTMNVIIGFFATMSICCTTICVIGVIPLAGWKLGVSISSFHVDTCFFINESLIKNAFDLCCYDILRKCFSKKQKQLKTTL